MYTSHTTGFVWGSSLRNATCLIFDEHRNNFCDTENNFCNEDDNKHDDGIINIGKCVHNINIKALLHVVTYRASQKVSHEIKKK